MQNFTLILYGTDACHLCDQVNAMLETLNASLKREEKSLFWNTVDIIEDEILMEKYSLLIPVLHIENTNTALHWPFTQKQLSVFLTPYL
jgi:hypothetical protein